MQLMFGMRGGLQHDKTTFVKGDFFAVCSYYDLFSIVQSGPRHDELSSESSISEQHEMELTFESKESDFLNRFNRNRHCRKAWSRQHVSDQSGRHYAPIQPLAALLAMAKKLSASAVEPPVSGQAGVG
jgi:hypothetical protein